MGTSESARAAWVTKRKRGSGNRPSLNRTEVPTARDIAWAAGVYEGEGYCHAKLNRVEIKQKDRWLLERLRALFGGTIYQIYNTTIWKGEKKRYPIFMWCINSERARGFLMTIFLFLSPRRKEQIKVFLAR